MHLPSRSLLFEQGSGTGGVRCAAIAHLIFLSHNQCAFTLLVVQPEAIQAIESKSPYQVMLVKDIKVKIRLRSSNEENIQEIADSIQDIGLISPITVDTEGNLIAGFHRLQAHKLLGIKEIPVIISTQKELKARLQEIDENLKRAELNAIEKSLHIEERESILKQLNQLSVKGDNRYSAAGKSTQKQRAAEIGMSRRNYQYHKELENLHPEVKDLLSETDYSSKLMDLVLLSKESDEIQLAVTKALITGKVHSMKRALMIEKTKMNRIASPYVDGLPDFKERYGEMPKSIMHMGRPIEEGMKTLWKLAADKDEIRQAKWVTFFGGMSIRLYSWNPNHCAFLIDYYTRPGDTILDPFVGRGSTAISAIMLNRNFIGVDLHPDVVAHNQQVLGEYIDAPGLSWDIRCEDGVDLRSLRTSKVQIDAMITDPPYYENSETYSDHPLDLSNMRMSTYLERISIFFQELRKIIKPSILDGKKTRIYPAILKVGSYRRGQSGLVDMAIDFQSIAERCGWVLWDKTFISLNTPIQFLGFQRNYLHGYVMKNYETILVFAWFEGA